MTKITDSYRLLQEQMHMDPDYGMASVSYAPIVSEIVNRLGIAQLLDYGAGKARLFQNLKVDHDMQLQAYDPGVPDFAGEPVPMQMVACIDVLEHVEPECLDAVLDDLVRVTQVIGFFTVCTEPAQKTLPDGRNAHLIQRDLAWWLDRIMTRFELQTLQQMQNGFFLIVYSKARPLVETLQ